MIAIPALFARPQKTLRGAHYLIPVAIPLYLFLYALKLPLHTYFSHSAVALQRGCCFMPEKEADIAHSYKIDLQNGNSGQ